MGFVFYLSAAIAILATLRVISHTHPVRALLYLIVSLLAVSAVFFSLGAYFAGALEIIVYAGAIMVLFVFVVMMLNLGNTVVEQEKAWLKPDVWIGPSILSFVLLLTLIVAIVNLDLIEPNLQLLKNTAIDGIAITPKAVGTSLFGPYVLMAELTSMILLGGLVVAFHLGREQKTDNTTTTTEDKS